MNCCSRREEIKQIEKHILTSESLFSSVEMKFDFSYYQYYELKMLETVGEVSLKKMTEDLLFNTNDMVISTKALSNIFAEHFKEDRRGVFIKKWIRSVFFSLGRSKANEKELKNAYHTYRRFNIKLFILETLKMFSFHSIDRIEEETSINKTAKFFDTVYILFFFLIYGKDDLKIKSTILFNLLDYESKNSISSSSKSLNIILRKFIFVHLFMSDAVLNNYISEIDIETKENLDKGHVKALGSSEESKILSCLNSDVLLYKKFLYYLKESKGGMKDFVNYISHNLIFFEKKTNPKLDLEDFLEAMEKMEFKLFSPNWIKIYFINYMQQNKERTSMFISHLPKILTFYEKQTFKEKKDDRVDGINYEDVFAQDSQTDYRKFQKVLRLSENFLFVSKMNEGEAKFREMLDNPAGRVKKKKMTSTIYVNITATPTPDDQQDTSLKLGRFNSSNLNTPNDLPKRSEMKKFTFSVGSVKNVRKFLASKEEGQASTMNEVKDHFEMIKDEVEEEDISSIKVKEKYSIKNDSDVNKAKSSSSQKFGKGIVRFGNISKKDTMAISPKENNMSKGLFNFNSNSIDQSKSDLKSKIPKPKTYMVYNKKTFGKLFSLNKNHSDNEVSIEEDKIADKLESDQYDKNSHKKSAKPDFNPIINLNNSSNLEIEESSENDEEQFNDYKVELENFDESKSEQKIRKSKYEIEECNPRVSNPRISDQRLSNPRISDPRLSDPKLIQPSRSHQRVSINNPNHPNHNEDSDKFSTNLVFRPTMTKDKDTLNLKNISGISEFKETLPSKLRQVRTINTDRDDYSGIEKVDNNVYHTEEDSSMLEYFHHYNHKEDLNHNKEVIKYEIDRNENENLANNVNFGSLINSQERETGTLNKLSLLRVGDVYEASEKTIEKNEVVSKELDEDTITKRSVNLPLLFDKYFKSFGKLSQQDPERIKTKLYNASEAKINRMAKKYANEICIYKCKKDELYDICDNKITPNLVSFYMWLMQNYNIFLIKQKLINSEVKFVDIEFFKMVQESYFSDKNFSSVLNAYRHILLNENGDFFINSKEKGIKNKILIVPIYLENPIIGEKSLFLARFEFSSKKIIMYDASDILFKDHSIKSNYKIIFDTFFSFLIKNKLIPKEYSNWEIEVNLNCTCYLEEDFPIFILLKAAESFCKDEEPEFHDEVEYDQIRDAIFLQLSEFYLNLQD